MRKSIKSVELGKNIYSSFKIRMERKSVRENFLRIADASGFLYHWRKFITKESWFTESQVIMVVFHCNPKNEIIGHHLVSIGTLDSSICHQRDIFRSAIVNNSFSICCVFSHIGDTTPSEIDINFTKKIVECGKLLDVPVLDSIVVSPDGEEFTSLKDMGII